MQFLCTLISYFQKIPKLSAVPTQVNRQMHGMCWYQQRRFELKAAMRQIGLLSTIGFTIGFFSNGAANERHAVWIQWLRE